MLRLSVPEYFILQQNPLAPMQHRPCFLIILLLVLSCRPDAMAQDSSRRAVPGNKASGIRQAAEGLRQSLGTDNEEQTARSYEALARQLYENEEYAKSEAYYKKAREIYQQLGNKQRQLAASSRSLAKVQEAQQKTALAIQNYKAAAVALYDSNWSRANTNDARRLEYTGKPLLQEDYALLNTRIFETLGQLDELSNAFRKLGETQRLQHNTGDAVTSFQKAFDATDDPVAAAGISKDLAKAYMAENESLKAIAASEAALAQLQQAEDTVLQVGQLLDLAELYGHNEQPQKAGILLQRAYALALESGHTLQAKACAVALANYYRGQGAPGKSLEVYEDLAARLDALIRSDSSLVDAQVFAVTEGRIKELERERVLQGELIRKQHSFNYFLAGAVMLMLLLLLVLARSRYVISVANKKIALQSLRREMNPHFIFNSLNSINHYIAEHRELEANKYLASYSGLMRTMMEQSNKDFVSLATEAEQLKKYLDLEQLRFSDKFDYTMHIDEALDPETTMIPNMLIQPQLENAVWHGLRYKATKGQLQLSFLKKGRQLQVLITDDGIGVARSSALKTKNQKAHTSLGLANTKERIRLLNELYKSCITMQISTLREEEDAGTQVLLELPLTDKI